MTGVPSPADLYRGEVRTRGYTLHDLVASALAATTAAELSAVTRALLASDLTGWYSADVGPLLRMTWARRLIRRPGRVSITQLLRALSEQIEGPGRALRDPAPAMTNRTHNPERSVTR